MYRFRVLGSGAEKGELLKISMFKALWDAGLRVARCLAQST